MAPSLLAGLQASCLKAAERLLRRARRETVEVSLAVVLTAVRV